MKTDFTVRVCKQLNISWEPSQNSKHYTNKHVSFSASGRSRDKTKHLQYAPQIDRPKAIKQATDEPKWSETSPRVVGSISRITPCHQDNNSTTQTQCGSALQHSVNSHALSVNTELRLPCSSKPDNGPLPQVGDTSNSVSVSLDFHITELNATQKCCPLSPLWSFGPKFGLHFSQPHIRTAQQRYKKRSFLTVDNRKRVLP